MPFHKRITKTVVDALQPGEECRDSELKGFGVRRRGASSSYFVHTRINGRLKRLTIGKHGSPFTPETARKEAARLLVHIRAGGNPAAERDDRRRVQVTFEQASETFFLQHVAKLKPRTSGVYRTLFSCQLNVAFGRMAIGAVRYADIAKAHAGWSSKPRTANHAIAVLSKFLNWCETQGLREKHSNPCPDLKRYREIKRERYLSHDELTRLGEVLAEAWRKGDINRYVVSAILLLLLTGARLQEVLTMKWSYVDLNRRRIRLPDSKTGQKTLVLGDFAIRVLQDIVRLQGNEYVLPGHAEGSHLVGIHHSWRTICARAGLQDLRLHDLRHSFASFAVDAGGSLPVIGRLLGHSSPQTTARYAHVAADPSQKLADAADKLIGGKLRGMKDAQVKVPMFRRRPLAAHR